MTGHLKAPHARRASVPLTERDDRDLARLRESQPYQEALDRLAGTPQNASQASEAGLLHAVIEVGLASIREAAEDAGYAELALDSTEHTEAREAARRRRPSWADDE